MVAEYFWAQSCYLRVAWLASFYRFVYVQIHRMPVDSSESFDHAGLAVYGFIPLVTSNSILHW